MGRVPDLNLFLDILAEIVSLYLEPEDAANVMSISLNR
jgi:hypothetical protein